MFDDRFARQNRFGPPPEFPLASTYTSIVHHLSGTAMYALALPHLKSIRQAGVAPHSRENKDHTSVTGRQPSLSIRL